LEEKESMHRRVHSREFKLELVRQIATAQKRPAQVCREHNLAESVLLRWRREYEARGEEAYTAKQLSKPQALEAKVAELERFCGQLALENNVLKRRSKAPARRAARHDHPDACTSSNGASG
jgi:transposase